MPRLARRTLLYAALFVFSGCAGLIYEVVWTRYLVDIFGVTAFAVSTVLVSFMGGMALGAALLGGWVDRIRRPLRAFAVLEAGIGAFALVFPLLLGMLDHLHRTLASWFEGSFFAMSLTRFAFCLVVLSIPTILMGGTLPALGRGLLQGERIGRGIGLLYFVNTAGAAVGCFLAGFHLLPMLGLRGATWVAVVLNLGVALGAWWLDRGHRDEPAIEADAEPATPDPATLPDFPVRWPLFVAWGSGALALAFEVVWFRVLVLVFGSTVYSFSAMLSVFLLGLAVGAALIGPLADRSVRPLQLLFWTQAAVALCALIGVFGVNSMPDLFLRTLYRFGLDFDGMNSTKLLLSFGTLFPPAVAFGATFPVAVRCSKLAGEGQGRRIGRVYAWNTFGAILGSFLAGFFLVPSFGAENTLRGIVVGAALLAAGTTWVEAGVAARKRALATILVVGFGAAAVWGPRWDRRTLGAGVYFEPGEFMNRSTGRPEIDRTVSDFDVMTYTEGYNETIISYRSSQGKFITVNGSTTASDHFEDMFSQRMLGHLPMALHPGEVRHAMIVGLGAGVTAGAIAIHDVEQLVAVELEKGVFDASRFFAEENHDILSRPNVEIVIDDGKSYLKRTDRRFDVISSAPNFPSLTGSGALYSREFFELCRSRLAEGGTMTQFTPIWRLEPRQVRTILASFGDEFPYVRVFNTGLSLVLLGRETPFPAVDPELLNARFERPEVRASLSGVGVRGPIELLSYYQFDEEELATLTEGVPRSTRNHPRVEFGAPRNLFSNTVAANLAMLARVRPSAEVRADRLGLTGERRDSFLILSAANEATAQAEIAFHAGRSDEAFAGVLPVAESGHRYGRYVAASKAERIAVQLQRAGDLENAERYFRLAMRFEPDRLTTRVGLGFVLMHRGETDAAVRVLQDTVERYPRSQVAIYRLGLALLSSGRAGEAEARFVQALDMRPSDPKPHALLGSLRLQRGEWGAALERFRRAYRLGDRSEGLINGLSRAWLQSGRPDRALEKAREGRALHPASQEARDLEIASLEALGRPDEAEALRRDGGQGGSS